MKNFEFQNPTKIIFGRGTEEKVGEEVQLTARIFCCISGAGVSKCLDCMTV